MLRIGRNLGGPRPSQVLLLLLLTMGTSGCSARRSSQQSEQGTEAITVRVRNNLVPGSAVIVRMFSQSGSRTVLGTVPPGATRNLRFEESLIESFYRLTAEADDGRNRVSRTFTVSPNMLVEWNLRVNNLDFTFR